MCFLYQHGFWRDLRKNSSCSMCRLPLVKISRFKNFVSPKGRERYNQIHGIEIITFLMFAAAHMVICFHIIFFLSFYEYVAVKFRFLYMLYRYIFFVMIFIPYPKTMEYVLVLKFILKFVSISFIYQLFNLSTYLLKFM